MGNFTSGATATSQMQKMKTKFVDNGIPVMIGEFMAVKRVGYANLTGVELQRHLTSRTYFDKTVADTCRLYGIALFYWDRRLDGHGRICDVRPRHRDPGCMQALTGGPALPSP